MSAWEDLYQAGDALLARAIGLALAGEHTLRVIGPLDCGAAALARLAEECSVPAGRWQWVQPCPCEHLGDMHRECTCSPRLVERWLRRLRRTPAEITARVNLPNADAYRRQPEPLVDVLERAEEAAAILETWPADLPLGQSAETLLHAATERLPLSPEDRRRVLAVARTIAAGQRSAQTDRTIGASALAEAVQWSSPCQLRGPRDGW